MTRIYSHSLKIHHNYLYIISLIRQDTVLTNKCLKYHYIVNITCVDEIVQVGSVPFSKYVIDFVKLLFLCKGLPFLFGVHIQSKPYALVIEFHGLDGNCVTVGHAAKNLSLDVMEWAFILEKQCGALDHIHKKGGTFIVILNTIILFCTTAQALENQS